jgi:hypothetical protein
LAGDSEGREFTPLLVLSPTNNFSPNNALKNQIYPIVGVFTNNNLSPLPFNFLIDEYLAEPAFTDRDSATTFVLYPINSLGRRFRGKRKQIVPN